MVFSERSGAWLIASVVGALACGPVVSSATSSDGSTSGDASSTDLVESTGADDVTTTIADTSTTSESTGEPATPGCEMPGSCDEACAQWEKIVESPNGAWIQHVAVAPDGTILAIEVRQLDEGENGGAVLRAFDVGGEPVFEQPLIDHEAAIIVSALAVAADGTIAIIENEDVSLWKEVESVATLDVRTSAGLPSWSAALGGESPSMTGRAVAFAPNGAIIVAGQRNAGPVDWSGFSAAYGSGGDLQWELDGDDLALEYGAVTGIARASTNDLVLSGFSDQELWLAAIDLDGNVAWTMTEPEADRYHAAIDIAVTAEGEVLAVGVEIDGSGYPIPWFGRFAADGSAIASTVFEEIAKGPHELDGIEVTDDGRIFVAGIRVNESGGTSRHVLELACDGTAAWEWTDTNPKEYDYANGGGLAWSPSTGLAIGGSDYIGEDFTRRGFLALLVP